MKQEIKKHVKTNCATYAGDGCCLLDRPCPFFNGEEGARCLYYENAVLPEDDKLKSRYWARFGLAYWGEDSKTCKRCENVYTPTDKRQQYCSNCRDEQRRERAKLRKRKQRRNGSK